MFEEIEAIVTGKVRGVMYRDFVQKYAGELGITGFAENLEDGSVRVVAQGTPDALKSLIDRMHEGSVLSRIEHVAVTWRSPERQFSEFNVHY